LLKLHRQALPQRSVKDRVASRVREIGEHNRVLVGEFWCAVEIEVTADRQRKPSHDSGNNHPQLFSTAAWSFGSYTGGRRREVRMVGVHQGRRGGVQLDGRTALAAGIRPDFHHRCDKAVALSRNCFYKNRLFRIVF